MGMTTKTRVSRWYVAIGVLGCAVYFALPRSAHAQIVFVVLAVSAPIVGILALRSVRSPGTVAWRVITIGVGLAAAGEVVDFVCIAMNARPHAGPVIDVIFLTAYMIQLLGLMTLFRAQTASRHQFGWFDTVCVGVVVGTVVWSTMYEAIFGNGHDTPLEWLTRFGGATLGVAMAVMALRLVIGARGRQSSFNLLLAALLFQVVTDSIAALWSGYSPGSRLDAFWVIGYVLMGTALLRGGQPSTTGQAPTRLADVEIKHTLVLQAAVTIVLTTMIMIEVSGHVPVVSLAVWGIAWLVILVMTRVRVLGLLRLVGVASATENQRRLTAMVASSSDIIGLADPDGTIRYLTPSIARIAGVPVEEWIGQRFDTMLSRCLIGIDDLAVRSARLGHGESATWECSIRSPNDDVPRRTVKLTLANQIDTPEVNGWVITAHDVTEEAQLTAELRHQSLHDKLTGLPNRALLFDRIQHSIDRLSRSSETSLSVVLVDIDDFKAVNDSLGHTTGDELLRGVAERLSTCMRQGDTVARLGGDEFAILLEDTDQDEAMVLAQRALESLALPVHIDSGDFAVRASAGVVSLHGAQDPVELLRSADIAMYASKRDGKSRVTLFHPDMHDIARRQLELRMDLTVALERNELFLAYQPIIDTQTREISGAEALLRWNHPTSGPVSPVEFIPVAEQSGQIRSIGEWVLRTACAEAAAWTDGGANSHVSVNVSAPQLNDQFIDLVLTTLVETGLQPHRLMLEITESMLVDDSVNARSMLTRLRDLGVRIAIDDFGTGFSSLAYFQSLCVDVVKIDRSFVCDLDTNTDHQALTRTILSLADGFAMTAIAEGVETDQELAALSRLGCQYAQGFLFSRPVAPAELRELFEQSNTAHVESLPPTLTRSQ
jgi:diguanylate cyclase (GGDEF)-like protein/PAS domain S-box-containing protein